jgi:hypothetical protein
MTCGSIPFIGVLLAALLLGFFTLVPVSETTNEAGLIVAPTPVMFEHVETIGGVEVFPAPDRASGREFAASMGFAPHAAGHDRSGEWVYIYYFEDGQLVSGWAPARQIALEENQFESLPMIDPLNLPVLPDLTYDDSAARPFGVDTPPPSTETP